MSSVKSALHSALKNKSVCYVSSNRYSGESEGDCQGRIMCRKGNIKYTIKDEHIEFSRLPHRLKLPLAQDMTFEFFTCGKDIGLKQDNDAYILQLKSRQLNSIARITFVERDGA